MTSEMSVLGLIGDASLVVQLVMLVLVLASVLSWTVIVMKWRVLRAARADAETFEDRFWSGIDLAQLFEQTKKKDEASAIEQIFVSGFREYARLHKQQRLTPMTISDNVHRSMRVTMSREIDALETYLSFLATVGSTSPYVGLFGTVWGIMNSFMALSGATQATLAAVAPGIAEALIATAIGLVAAIPAVVAYNRYADDVERLVNRYDNFLEEFTTLLQRQALAHQPDSPTATV